jgi:ribosomal protein L11 methyltransferase
VRVYPALRIQWPDPPPPERVGLLLAALDEAGPVGADEVPAGVRVFFTDAASREAGLRLAAGAAPDARVERQDVPDEDWAARSQASITPVQVGRLLVSPPWAAMKPAACEAAGLEQVVIRPAMGFGTGHHASTRLCLGLLQAVPLAGSRVLDVGTGSGVLALAAWRLGAAGVTAFDHDADAVASAHENIDLNPGAAVRLDRRELGDPPAGESPYDVVLANLTGAMLARMAPAIGALATGTGVLIVSGILAEEADDVAAAFKGAGWAVAARRAEDEWVGLLLRPLTSPSGSTAR